MSDERVTLTPEEALSVLANKESIHTFRDANGVLLGCDWGRSELVKTITESRCEVGGDACRAMKHGLVVWTSETNPLFVECDDNLLARLTQQKATTIPAQS